MSKDKRANRFVERIQQGEQEVMEDIFHAYLNHFLQWVQKYFPKLPKEEKEKALAEAIILVCRKVKSGTLNDIDQSHLYKVAKHFLIYDHIHGERMQTVTRDILREEGVISPKVNKKSLERIMQSINKESSDLLQLLYLERRSPEEIKEMLGFSSSEAVLAKKSQVKKEIIRYILNTE